MALTRLNYAPWQYETCTNETLTPASPVLNTWYHFEIGDWKHLLSDIVLKQGGSAIPAAAFELAEDTKYTAREATESGKTIYAKWRIVDGDYDGIATTVSGNNFGSYIDNEKLDARLDALEAFDAALDAGGVPYDNSASGLTADDVQAAIDEIHGDASKIDYDNATSGLAATDVQAAIDEVEDIVDGLPVPSVSGESVLLNGSNTSASVTVNFMVLGGTVSGTNVMLPAIKIAIVRPANNNYTVNYYISPTLSGAEVGSTSWWNALTRTSGQGSTAIYVNLQPGWYRLHIVQSASSGSDVTVYTISQKTIDTGIAY